jgi:NTE family protein
MAGPASFPVVGFHEASRWGATRLLRREARALRAAGADVVVFRPDRDVQLAMGDDFMASANVEGIVQQAFFAAGAHAAQPSMRPRLELLRR